MLRSLWQKMKDYLFDTTSSTWYDQEGVDSQVWDDFQGGGYTVVDDIDNIPSEYRYRPSHQFLTPGDCLAWLEDTGVPANYVYIYDNSLGPGPDDHVYQIFIADGG